MSEAAGPPPSRDQGWGRINLARTLRLTSDQPALLAVDQSPGFAEAPAFPFQIYLRLTKTNRPLQVTLVWSDYPATPGADQHLVNDLDFRVRKPQLALKVNRLTDAQSVPGGDFDRLNNVERVNLAPSEAEIVEISVWAHRIMIGPQDFALVATGDFEVISPQQDEDDDGLPDFWERWHFGDLTPRPDDDDDGDGAFNAAELAANTDPTNADSLARLKVANLESSEVTLSMNASEGRRYVLERSVAGSPNGPWSVASEPEIIGAPLGEAFVLFTDIPPAQEAEPGPWFYRVRIDGPPGEW